MRQETNMSGTQGTVTAKAGIKLKEEDGATASEKSVIEFSTEAEQAATQVTSEATHEKAHEEIKAQSNLQGMVTKVAQQEEKSDEEIDKHEEHLKQT